MNIIEFLLQLLFEPMIFVPLIFPGLLTVTAVIVILIWLERKMAAKVQLRYGPLYVSKPLGGALQMVADLLKFLFAELIVPKGADKKAFLLSPIVLFTFSVLPVLAIPLSSGYAAIPGDLSPLAIDNDLSLLIVPALLTLAPIFVLILGWASDNKFSFIGGLREGYMMMAYETAMFVSVLAMAVTYNSLSLIRIVENQSNGLWGIVLNPLAALAFFAAMLMTTARFPFDITEAESEIVIGPYTEYSGIYFGLCLGASYAKLYVFSLLFAEIFLGGWNPLFWPLNTNPILPGLIVLVKAFLVMVLCVFLRSVYPRFRIDQALQLGWHKLLAVSVASVILSLAVIGWVGS